MRIQQNLTLPQQKIEHSNCPNCGKEIYKPLFAVIDSDYIIEEYYGCPYCLAKIRDVVEKKIIEAPKNEMAENLETDSRIIESETTFLVDEEKDEEEPEEPLAIEDKSKPEGCIHYAGYLKNRPKNTPVPDECLTCIEMINCMH